MPTDREPLPRAGASPPAPYLPDWPLITDWPRRVRTPERDFVDVLNSRRSTTGGPVDERSLASLLRHSTMLRTRRSDGRFGTWESRSAPSSGGLHAIHLLCLPIGDEGRAGIYHLDRHGLLAPDRLDRARELNAASVLALTGATAGTTIQFIADQRRYEACYDAPQSLLWRDSGALAAVISLVATALDLVAIPLGRHGGDIVELAGLGPSLLGAGGIHLGTRQG